MNLSPSEIFAARIGGVMLPRRGRDWIKIQRLLEKVNNFSRERLVCVGKQ
jgi:hypothetical protein